MIPYFHFQSATLHYLLQKIVVPQTHSFHFKGIFNIFYLICMNSQTSSPANSIANSLVKVAAWFSWSVRSDDQACLRDVVYLVQWAEFLIVSSHFQLKPLSKLLIIDVCHSLRFGSMHRLLQVYTSQMFSLVQTKQAVCQFHFDAILSTIPNSYHSQ